MRRITLYVLSTLSALVLLFSYHTSTSSAGSVAETVIAGRPSDGSGSTAGQSGSSGSSGSSGTSSGSSSGTSSGSAGTSSGSAGTSSGSVGSSSGSSSAKTYDGDTVQTQWGAVQVQISVKGGKITSADVLQVPWDNGHDQQINSYAVPILNSEVTSAQSARIDMVSGATVTSDGYIASLQSAIDRAGL